MHGHAALAAGISTGIAVEARAGRTPGESRLRVPAWNLEASAGDGTPVGRALEAIVRRIEAPGLDFVADARIPSRAGLGSSAALSVAIARAAAAAVGRADATDAIDAAVMAAEEVFHGSPSGIDAAAAKSGVTGRFTRATGWQPVPVLQKITLCVGLSGRPRDTGGAGRRRGSAARSAAGGGRGAGAAGAAGRRRRRRAGEGRRRWPRADHGRRARPAGGAAAVVARARHAGARRARGRRGRRQADGRGGRRRGDRAGARARAGRAGPLARGRLRGISGRHRRGAAGTAAPAIGGAPR